MNVAVFGQIIVKVRGADALRTFSCFITDDRYSVPTLTFLLVADEKLAREMALRRLLESPHHRNVELLENGERVFERKRPSHGGVADALAL
jgi:hypothetical protein